MAEEAGSKHFTVEFLDPDCLRKQDSVKSNSAKNTFSHVTTTSAVTFGQQSTAAAPAQGESHENELQTLRRELWEAKTKLKRAQIDKNETKETLNSLSSKFDSLAESNKEAFSRIAVL